MFYGYGNQNGYNLPSQYANYNDVMNRMPQSQQINLLRVNGVEGARAYNMPPNSTIALFDANEDIFYVKSSDSGGFANIKAFRFVPCEQPQNAPQMDVSQFVTRKEFEELKGEINGKQSIPKSDE